jgi:hypothetical protein
MKATLKAHGTKRLKLNFDILLSNFGFNFNLRCYTLVGANFAPSRWLAAPALGPALTPLLTGTPANGAGGDRPTGDLAVVAAPLPSACQAGAYTRPLLSST